MNVSRLLRFCVLGWILALAPRVHAHVGSPYIVFEGRAGQIPVRVVVRQPDVVPGLADISVRVLEGQPRRVLVLPLHATTDRSGAPTPDIASPGDSDPRLYSAALWLMTRGAYGIEVQVEADGGGTVVVPVNSVAFTRQPMPPVLAWILAVLGVGLAAGFVSIIIAAARESTLPAGANPGRSHRVRTALAAGLGSLTLAGMVYGGAVWWSREDRFHDTRRLHRPWEHRVSVQTSDPGNVLTLALTDARRREPLQQLIPDHGKLIHLFLVSENTSQGIPALAHLHPTSSGEFTYTNALPPLPAGSYRVFTELAHEGGFTQTLTNRVDLPAGNARPHATDTDEAWSPGGPIPASTVRLEPGGSAQLNLDAAVAGSPSTLRVRFLQTDGTPAPLQPYLRMLGHAVILRDDGSVFAHLHPAGTLSMAATRTFARKLGGEDAARAADANCGDLEALPAGAAQILGRDGTVSFPYVFPQPGRYYFWCQVRIDGRVQTAAFAIPVAPAPAKRSLWTGLGTP